MGDNSQKTPVPKSLNQLSEKKILDAYQLLGKALPCSVTEVDGSIITVKFELKTSFTLPKVKISMVGLEYIRYPTQVGDKGFVIPADALLGGINGLGSGVASLTRPANLGALVFVPISSADWSETDDPDAVLIYGPNGVIIRDVGKNCIITLDQTQIVLKMGDNASITIKDGEIDIDATTIKLNGIVWGTHEHGNVTAGSAKTGGPTAP